MCIPKVSALGKWRQDPKFKASQGYIEWDQAELHFIFKNKAKNFVETLPEQACVFVLREQLEVAGTQCFFLCLCRKVYGSEVCRGWGGQGHIFPKCSPGKLKSDGKKLVFLVLLLNLNPPRKLSGVRLPCDHLGDAFSAIKFPKIGSYVPFVPGVCFFLNVLGWDLATFPPCCA